MSVALDLLQRAQQHGLHIEPAGDKLRLRAERQPPDDLLAEMRQHKAELLALLSGSDVWGDVHEERAANIEHDGVAPRAWTEGLARLNPARPPCDVPPARWLRFNDDCGLFIDEWARKADRLGWTPVALFGCDLNKPYLRIDRAGLLWLVNGRRIAALSSDSAAIETKSGNRLTFRRSHHSEAEAVVPWDVWDG